MISVPGYDIKREIGVGGMATVYLAVQTSLEREVALKVMNPALVTDPSFSRRFLDEARTLASLSHPNIVSVYDVGVTEHQLHYFTMQHLPGGDLASRIGAGMSEADLLAVFTGLARALGFAHQRGFVHRDVSPGNVMFDGAAHPVLTDFGIARALSRTSRLTNAGASVGTSQYMSPEQARGGEVDARSDLYSLGCVMFEALSGKPPYEGEDGFAIAYAHVFEAIPRLPDKYKHWQPIIDRLLAKDPRERYKDSDELQHALAELANGVAAAGSTQTVAPLSIVLPSSNPAVATKANLPLPAPTETVVVRTVEPPAGASRMPIWRLLVAGGVLAAGIAIVVVWALSNMNSPPKRRLPDLSATVPSTAPPSKPLPHVEPLPAHPATDPSPTEPDKSAAGEGSGDPPPLANGSDGQPVAVDEPAVAAPLTPAAEAAALQLAIQTTAVDPINQTLYLAKADLTAQRLTQPAGRNAIDRFRTALKLAEHFKAKAEGDRARQGLADTASAIIELAEKKLVERKDAEFIDLMRRAEEVASSVPEGASVAERVRARRSALRDEAVAAGRKAMGNWDKTEAVAAFERALLFVPGDNELAAQLKRAQRVGDPGYAFRDGANGDGPEMIVVNAGGKRLAIGRGEATLGEFRRYFKEAGQARRGATKPSCRDREGGFLSNSRTRTFEAPDFSQTAENPVVCVTYDDAVGYAEWLGKRTGHKYRLPTAAEWLAIAPKSAAGECKANLADQSFRSQYKKGSVAACDDGFANTAPVRHFDAAANGVYDMAGNVREWVSDCGKSCKQHLALGSAWVSETDASDVGQQKAFDADEGSNTVGIRVVREIE